MPMKWIITRLGEAYVKHPVEVAMICDEYLDRSGNLLGKVREVAERFTA